MEFTLRELKTIEPSLIRLLDAKLNVKTAYRLTKFSKALIKELRDLEDARAKYVRDHGVKDDNGNFAIDPAGKDWDPFQKQMDDLLNATVDLPLMKVAIADLQVGDQPVLTVADIANLSFIIDGSEA